jgi:hypothetical protein
MRRVFGFCPWRWRWGSSAWSRSHHHIDAVTGGSLGTPSAVRNLTAAALQQGKASRVGRALRRGRVAGRKRSRVPVALPARRSLHTRGGP